MKKVVVIGAGLGGLSAAIRLSRAGFRVIVLEKNDRVGGKMDFWREGGYTFDTGPSLLTMPFVVRDLFQSAGRDVESYLNLVAVDPVCRYFYPDGVTLDAWTDPEKMRTEIQRVAPGDRDGFEDFLRHGKRIYEVAAEPFLFSGFGSLRLPDIVHNLKHLPALARLDAFRSLSSAVEGYVEDTHLRQLLKRFATYNGSSPYLAPATLAIIPYVEFLMGGWYIRGGMYTLARAMEHLALDAGTEIRVSQEVREITRKGRDVTGVRTSDGSQIDADTVLCNADALYAAQTLLGDEHRIVGKQPEGEQVSLSGFVMMLGVRRSFTQLLQHNIFFSADYHREFDLLVKQQLPADDPTIYVTLTCKVDEKHAPNGHSNLFVLVNAPHVDGKYDWGRNKLEYRDHVLKKLASAGLGDLEELIEVERILTPVDFEQRYNAFKGSIYGLSSNGRMAAFSRPPNKSRSYRGLYFVGGSSHPGGGIPLVLLSGKIVAQMVAQDLKQ